MRRCPLRAASGVPAAELAEVVWEPRTSQDALRNPAGKADEFSVFSLLLRIEIYWILMTQSLE